MKIGIVCYPTFGGSGVVATELGKGLAKVGHEVHFITYKQPMRLDFFSENLIEGKVFSVNDSLGEINNSILISESISKKVINEIPNEWNDYDVILGDQLNIQNIKWIKILKYGKKTLLKNPKAIFTNERNIKFQFDVFHGDGILDKAIDLLDKENRDDFRLYVNNMPSFNRGNMFVSKSKKLIKDYYLTIFDWLNECEKLFGFELEGYSKMRIYGFLAERFLPYWFNKNAKTLEWPILFQDLNDE